MSAIQQYKAKLIDLKSKEEDFNNTIEKLEKAKKVYDTVKKKRYDEFMEGFNTISGKLKEMYQVR
jgi:structural maintenance of chromosome 4